MRGAMFEWLPIVLALTTSGSPDEAAARYHLEQGRRFHALHNLSRAQNHFRAAFQADPRSAEALVELASLDVSRARLNDARLLAIEASRRDSSSTRVLALLEGLALGTSGDEPASLVLVRYMGVDPGDGGGRGEGSLGVGSRLNRDLLLVAGVSASGRIARIDPELTVSSGLRIEPDGAGGFAVTARERASTAEEIGVTDRRTGLSARTRLRIVGPLVHADVGNSIARRRAIDVETLPPGSDVTFGLSLVDAAGNRLYRPRIDWEARSGGEDVRAWLSDPESVRHPDFFFESHRCQVRVPKTAVAGQNVEVTAREPASGVFARFRVRVAAEDASTVSARGPVFRASFEEAIEAARRDARPAMVIFTAEW